MDGRSALYWTDVWMGGGVRRADAWMLGWTDEITDGRVDALMGRCLGGKMLGKRVLLWTDAGQINDRVDGRVLGWVDGRPLG